MKIKDHFLETSYTILYKYYLNYKEITSQLRIFILTCHPQLSYLHIIPPGLFCENICLFKFTVYTIGNDVFWGLINKINYFRGMMKYSG